ncbi:MAG: hypothetical protein HOP91_03790 [Sphingomonas sp.]|nr:hypothetical protein [Sphingomonas sp.]
MRSLLAALLVGSATLAGCHKAETRQNREMAQCMGAMTLEHTYIVEQQSPRYDLLPPLMAAITWYQYKLRVAGVPDRGRVEAMAFFNQHIHDPNLGKMVTACGHKLWADPEYRANFDDLIRHAIEIDRYCKPDPSRCRLKPSQPPHPRHP